MRKRSLSDLEVSEIGFGTWALGGSWGPTDDQEAMRALRRAAELGINLFDTADVYGDGHSERLLARLNRELPDPERVIAPKAGRRPAPHLASAYTQANLEAWVRRSLKNLETERLDLLQLHCPPSDVYRRDSVYEALEWLVHQGLIARWGVSVERVDEALEALKHPGLASIQIIYNLFRQRPAQELFPRAAEAGVGIIVRVPLASGLLTGKLRRDSQFDPGDHRSFNRRGESFDQGETFSGVDYALGLEAAQEIGALLPAGMTTAQLALRWILMREEVASVIPGGRHPAQVEENASSSGLPPLPEQLMAALAEIYQRKIAPSVHQRW